MGNFYMDEITGLVLFRMIVSHVALRFSDELVINKS